MANHWRVRSCDADCHCAGAAWLEGRSNNDRLGCCADGRQSAVTTWKATLMDDLMREFLTETSESLDTVDNQLVRFEQEPNNAKILDNIFRLVHTIKGACGFLGLPRLEALAHAAEPLMGKFRDGMPVTGEAVTLILSSIDRIKEVLFGLESTQAEPEGGDKDLIRELERMAM